MAYSSYISWESPDSPVPCEVYPSLAFDSLFENSGSRRMESILDRVSGEAAGLRRRISQGDRAKLDEYLMSVREVEQRAQRMRGDLGKAAGQAKDSGKPLAAMKRPDNGLPEDIREHNRLMCDIVALAIQTDKTRIATMLMCRDLSGLFYPFLQGAQCPPSRLAQRHFGRVRAHHAPLRHPARLPCRPPAIHAGRAGHGPGQHLPAVALEHVLRLEARQLDAPHPHARRPGRNASDRPRAELPGQGDENRKLCSLYLSLMDRMGVKLEHFGDADARLAGI